MKKKYTFKTRVDPDVQKQYSVRFPAHIEFLITVYLNDPDGWESRGYSFESVSDHEDILIRLSSPDTINKVCGISPNLSCAILGEKNIYLNADRWFHGSAKSGLSLDDYRQYIVSHEVGHILGFDHKTCPCNGCPAPVMMQQTLGIGKCIPNTKITDESDS